MEACFPTTIAPQPWQPPTIFQLRATFTCNAPAVPSPSTTMSTATSPRSHHLMAAAETSVITVPAAVAQPRICTLILVHLRTNQQPPRHHDLQQIRRTPPRLREACSAHHHGHRRPATTSVHRPDRSSGHHFTSQTHLDEICVSNFTIFIHACTCKTSAAPAMAAIAPPPSSLAGEGGALPSAAPSLHLCSQGRKEEGAANPNSGERVLCATCQHLIGQSNWSTLVNWSKSSVKSGQNCKYG